MQSPIKRRPRGGFSGNPDQYTTTVGNREGGGASKYVLRGEDDEDNTKNLNWIVEKKINDHVEDDEWNKWKTRGIITLVYGRQAWTIDGIGENIRQDFLNAVSETDGWKNKRRGFIIRVREKEEYNEYNKKKTMGMDGSCFKEIIRELRALHDLRKGSDIYVGFVYANRGLWGMEN